MLRGFSPSVCLALASSIFSLARRRRPFRHRVADQLPAEALGLGGAGSRRAGRGLVGGQLPGWRDYSATGREPDRRAPTVTQPAVLPTARVASFHIRTATFAPAAGWPSSSANWSVTCTRSPGAYFWPSFSATLNVQLPQRQAIQPPPLDHPVPARPIDRRARLRSRRPPLAAGPASTSAPRWRHTCRSGPDSPCPRRAPTLATLTPRQLAMANNCVLAACSAGIGTLYRLPRRDNRQPAAGRRPSLPLANRTRQSTRS